jgi:hypothetical protein
MNVEIGTEAEQVPEKECINEIFVAVWDSPTPGICVRRAHGTDKFNPKFTGRRRDAVCANSQCWNLRTIYGSYRNQVGIGLSYRPARLL